MAVVGAAATAEDIETGQDFPELDGGLVIPGF